MHLYLVQHGDAVSDAVDPRKPLSPKGRQTVAELSRACRGFGVKAVEVLHSGKLRALETAEILGDFLGIPVRASAGLDPLDPPRPFAAEIEGWTDSRIIVGHLPFLERLASLLAAGREEPSMISFQRGGMVCLEKRASSDWRIQWTFFPDQPKSATAKE